MKAPTSPSALTIATDMFKVNVHNTGKLVTKEDGNFFHVHKILGVLCLAHFIYRIILLFRLGNMGFDSSYFTLGCILCHMLLSGSSFIFHIPNSRIRAAPMIYPEFRLHSIIFAYRSLLTMILQWVAARYDIQVPLYLRGAVVIITMVCADLVTRSYKDQGTTMRGMPFPEYVPSSFRNQLNTFYSVSQIFATAEVIFANRMDEVFAVVFPIQLAALLMTCVRKTIISAGAWHNYYALSLLSNYLIGPFIEFSHPPLKPGGLFFPCAIVATIFRFNTRISKYVVWGIIGAVHLYAVLVMHRYDYVAF